MAGSPDGSRGRKVNWVYPKALGQSSARCVFISPLPAPARPWLPGPPLSSSFLCMLHCPSCGTRPFPSSRLPAPLTRWIMEEVIRPYEVIKTGVLKKLGGGGGGHKNWKDRFFVLSNHLAYYPTEKEYQETPDKPLGIVMLNAYFAGPVEGSAANFEFVVQAYPKSLTCRAASASEMAEWIDILRAPVLGSFGLEGFRAKAPTVMGGAGGEEPPAA